MTIEQKARAYDEALERARDYYKANKILANCDENDVLEDIFPEIAESEDEMIRKDIKRAISSALDYSFFNKETADNCLAWLEKQGKIDKESYELAEKERREFVGEGFIKCYADFQDFKEGETYWLEYVGNDNYNVRSDNLLGKTYHITPCQLYTIFKKMTWFEKQCEQKPAWSEEDEKIWRGVIDEIEANKSNAPDYDVKTYDRFLSWLESLKQRLA